MSMSKLNLLVLAVHVLLVFGFASAFAPTVPGAPRSSVAARMAASTEDSTLALQDSKGNDVQVGTIVKIVAEGLKAYQVSGKGFGLYEDGKFVPAAEGVERGLKNLALPVGMTGIVNKVYNVDEVSANHPIQAKFQPGKYNDESGLDPPVKFLMHFDLKEIEAV
mmetsp:Transcript_10606/g.17562  ORF Transcript_10606/g.17562 Transcript_10606/m.17562 type:complete len:164 (-) Transcript_10606:1025-1516(-)|eukprot:CAMPEP_0119002968 /NCGR_PEP_ID=MMETSP1176-20130426/270_1 /TAXON_ID=265551 /ORGANISM="Synedropsis recta cf, Strain CCMP1620" /LENGTH=163 /DNA_ID=CAMNT_0006954515 /DNA_START=104 /DNA_END=595 /DNA_ORIENTATION=+